MPPRWRREGLRRLVPDLGVGREVAAESVDVASQARDVFLDLVELEAKARVWRCRGGWLGGNGSWGRWGWRVSLAEELLEGLLGDLVTMKRDDILAMFPATRPGKNPPLNDPALLLTFVWQTWLKVRAGECSDVEGNIRTLWYQHVENLYEEHDLLPRDSSGAERDQAKELIIEIMSEQVERLVWHRIFRYRDELNFNRPADGIYAVGSRGRPGLLFHTEKEGLFKHCEQLHGDRQEPLAGEPISVTASQGQPSLLALEHFARDLKLRQVSKLRIGCLCDYDPWGLCIATALDSKMRRLGFNVTTWTLTTADLFQPHEVEVGGKDYTPLLKCRGGTPRERSIRSMVGIWYKFTRGIGGKPIAIHVDKANKDHRKERLKSFFEHLIVHDEAPPQYPKIEPGKYAQYQRNVESFLKRFAAEWRAAHPSATPTPTEMRAESIEENEGFVDVPHSIGGIIDQAYDSYR